MNGWFFAGPDTDRHGGVLGRRTEDARVHAREDLLGRLCYPLQHYPLEHYGVLSANLSALPSKEPGERL